MKYKITILILTIILVAIVFTQMFSSQEVNYEVKNCSLLEKMVVRYDEKTKTLVAFVNVNCCSDEIKVDKEGQVYKIVEKDYDGKLCRCFCTRKVLIFNVEPTFRVIFVDKDGKAYELSQLPDFCGWSTYGKCSSDSDCIVGGCSGQVCQSRYEKSIVTTCEWKICYNAKLYHLECKCVEGKCQWVAGNGAGGI